jgi:hypothetical protein
MDTTSLLAFAKATLLTNWSVFNDFVNPALAVAYVCYFLVYLAQTVMQPAILPALGWAPLIPPKPEVTNNPPAVVFCIF